MLELADAIFRTSSSYELVLLDRLTHAERELIGRVEGADDLYGVLRPRPGSPLEFRSASRDMALLLLTLRNPSVLPDYVRADLGADFRNAVAKLVLDGVLEIEHAGSFVSGADARDLVLTANTESGPGRIAALSLEALRYGQALEDMPTHELASRLYFYGRKPVSPLWQRRLTSEEAVRAYLGQTGGGTAQAVLDASWTEAPNSPDRPYWRMWHPRRGGSGSQAGGYKLYVSAECASLPDVFLAVAELLADAPGARGFKVGRDVFGLCRPDNLVAYFSRLEDLHKAASRLEARLEGCRVQGVPFTAEMTRDGLLSWGVNPPAEYRSPRAGSWRLWVVDRLAEYLRAARAASTGSVEPWRYALDRLSVDGVDTGTWVPVSRIWSRSIAIG